MAHTGVPGKSSPRIILPEGGESGEVFLGIFYPLHPIGITKISFHGG